MCSMENKVTSSIVQDLGVDKSGCGYCGNKKVLSNNHKEGNVASSAHVVPKRRRPNTRVSHGLWAHQLTVEDYEELMTRGWRRSGKYLYRPDNAESCCQQFAIRLDVEKFVPSKSQRRVLRKMEKVSSSCFFPKEYDTLESRQASAPQLLRNQKVSEDHSLEEIRSRLSKLVEDIVCEEAVHWGWKVWRNNMKSDANAPKCSYSSNLILVLAEQRNRESHFESPSLDSSANEKRKRQVSFMQWRDYYGSILKNVAENMFAQVNIDVSITSNGFMNFWTKDDTSNQKDRSYKKGRMREPIHSLHANAEQMASMKKHLRIVMELPKFEDESFLLFQRYQEAVHIESSSENSKESFSRFLVDSPLIYMKPNGNNTSTPTCGFGTFHMKYYLNERLLAVGVVDVLPHYLSSVYFFYDPSYAKFSLGVYSALQEINWVRMQSSQGYSSMKYYCMGFYIHNCPKMRYKGDYFPSQLRCELTGQWVQLEVAQKVLDEHNGRALRLAPDEFPIDEKYLVAPCERVFALLSMHDKERYRHLWQEALRKVPVLFSGKLLLFENLIQGLNDKLSSHFQSILLSYIAKVGPHSSQRIIYLL